MGWGMAMIPSPAGAVVAPGQVQSLVNNGGNGIGSVRWAPPASNGGEAIDQYLVQIVNVTTVTVAATQTVCGTCTWSIYGGLTNGHTYYVNVYAHNPSGGWGPHVSSNGIVPGASDTMAGAGEREDFTQQTFNLNDRMSAKVNLTTCNLQVSMTDFSLPMVNGSLPLGRVYNSLAAAPGSSAPYSGQHGYGWRSNQAPDVRLLPNTASPTTSTSVKFISATGNSATFTRTSTGFTPFTTPYGLARRSRRRIPPAMTLASTPPVSGSTSTPPASSSTRRTATATG